jgi:cytochrome oxidase assembly protein ShyY1
MKRIWQYLATALLVAIFLSLANWQWNRAAQLKKPVVLDQSISPIDSVISPSGVITQEMVGKKVEVEGTYESNWIAPRQDGNKSWDVGLFKTKDNAMILVVRGFHKVTNPGYTYSGNVKVVGYLVPPQSSTVAETKVNQIGRVDSSLFVTKTNLPLYAPYIQATSETPDSGYEVVPFEMGSDVPGFYWQHISYVVIWFLFAVTAIYLLFYQRRLDKVQL